MKIKLRIQSLDEWELDGMEFDVHYQLLETEP